MYFEGSGFWWSLPCSGRYTHLTFNEILLDTDPDMLAEEPIRNNSNIVVSYHLPQNTIDYILGMCHTIQKVAQKNAKNPVDTKTMTLYGFLRLYNLLLPFLAENRFLVSPKMLEERVKHGQ
jgi:hypothetical protein